MKVKLTGIRPYDPELDGEMDDDLIYYRSLLEQVPYPLETNAENNFPNAIDLTGYIVDEEYPYDLHRWGLIWFTYEEIKD